MQIPIELLFALCMSNNRDIKDTQACRSLSKAIVYQYKSELQEVDRVEQQLAAKLPPTLKFTISILSSLQEGKIVVPLVDKEW